MIYYYWITGYIIIGFVFTLIVEWANDLAIKHGYTEDLSPIENSDKWIISILWPLGVIIAIKAFIQKYFK
jgi:hypothetical protein